MVISDDEGDKWQMWNLTRAVPKQTSLWPLGDAVQFFRSVRWKVKKFAFEKQIKKSFWFHWNTLGNLNPYGPIQWILNWSTIR